MSKLFEKGFSTIWLAVSIVALSGVVGLVFWRANHMSNKSPAPGPTSGHPSTPPVASPGNDPAEGGKYLVIKEWGVRTALPPSLQNKTTYTIQKGTDPDTNLPLQGASILITGDFAGNCSLTSTPSGTALDSGIQYIRSDASQPFNAARYKGVFKANILQDKSYSYHLNYITPPCLGDGTSAQQSIHGLQTLAASLRNP